MADDMKRRRNSTLIQRLEARGELSDAEVLAFILRQMDPKADAERTAAALLDRFGTLADVLDAPPELLQETAGVNSRSAGLIAACPDIFRYYQESKNRPRERILDTQYAFHVVKSKFYGRKEEVMVLMILDSKGYLRYMGVVSEGGTHSVPLNMREIVRLCLYYQADVVYIGHNHPSGNCAPSAQDIASTKELEWTLSGVDVILADHFIFTDDDFFSMRSSGVLQTLKQEIALCKRKIVRGR